MLTEPASKVSVPLTVVMRTRSRVPPRAISPAPRQDMFVVFLKELLETHVFPEINVKTICPLVRDAARFELKTNPDVAVIVAAVEAPIELLLAVYPDVVTEPEPI